MYRDPLALPIVATTGLDNPSSRTEKIGKLLMSDNKLQKRLHM